MVLGIQRQKNYVLQKRICFIGGSEIKIIPTDRSYQVESHATHHTEQTQSRDTVKYSRVQYSMHRLDHRYTS